MKTFAICAFVKRTLIGFLACMLFIPASCVFAAEKAEKKPLVVYFSTSGNTRQIAEMIKNDTGADIVEIETVENYPTNYEELTQYAKKQLQDNERPAIKTKVPNLDDYGIIYLGFPNWWSSMPMPVYTFVEQNGLNGRTIAPFMTHGGGNLGHAIEDLKKLVPDSKVLKPFSVSGSRISRAQADVKKWLEEIK